MFSKLAGVMRYVGYVCAANFRQGNKIHVESSVGRNKQHDNSLCNVCVIIITVQWHDTKVNEAFSQRHSVAWVISQVPAAVISRAPTVLLQLLQLLPMHFPLQLETHSRAKPLPTFGDATRGWFAFRMSSFNILFAATHRPAKPITHRRNEAYA